MSAADADGGHVVPYYCPYCASEDLRPSGPQGGAWECRSCTRVFTVTFRGLVVTP